MLVSKIATEELVVFSGKRLALDLSAAEIGLLVRILEPLLGQDVYVAGKDEIMMVAIPEDRRLLASGDEIIDDRYLSGAMQVNLGARSLNADKDRRRELQDVIALVFRAIRA
jgi:hypothetical protein